MNIFKVLASGKKSFLEEQASAIIAWFMNPRMEHGMGFLFLSRFVRELQTRQNGLDEISSKLFTQLRSGSDTELKWSCKLEYDAFPDKLENDISNR
ncbi:MAG TPA: PD-(D/E)XK nuclease family protein [Clostridiaceae bacterium]|nr:PD-(D/E)XK nuclease family protein [Clostridiaceae bacterium]